jgi:hypothetical protein
VRPKRGISEHSFVAEQPLLAASSPDTDILTVVRRLLPLPSSSSTGISSHDLTSASMALSLTRRATLCISSWCGMVSK